MKHQGKVSKITNLCVTKYSAMALYDDDLTTRNMINHEDIKFINKKVQALIIIPDEPNSTLNEKKLFYIDYWFFM